MSQIIQQVATGLFTGIVTFIAGYAWGLIHARRVVTKVAAMQSGEFTFQMRCMSIMMRKLFDACIAAGIDTRPIIEASQKETAEFIQQRVSGKDEGYEQSNGGGRG